MRLAACIVVVAALALGEASAAAAPSAVPGTALSITPQTRRLARHVRR